MTAWRPPDSADGFTTCFFSNRQGDEGSKGRGSALLPPSNGIVFPPIKRGAGSSSPNQVPRRPRLDRSLRAPIAPSLFRDDVDTVEALWQGHEKGKTSRGRRRASHRSFSNKPFCFPPFFFFFFLAADAFFLPTADATRRLVATPSRLPPSPSLFQTLAYVCALGQRKVGVAPHATAVRGVEFVRRNLWERLPPALLCHCLLMPKKKKNSSADGLDFSRMQKKRARARSLSPRLSCAGEVGGL